MTKKHAENWMCLQIFFTALWDIETFLWQLSKQRVLIREKSYYYACSWRVART